MRLLFPAVAQLMAVCMAAEFPVREVILYKNGIGFFERSGRLPAGETARVDFKAAEMNDLLKSLTVEEQSGGKVTGIRYDASRPLAQRLSEFPFQVEGHAPLTAILDQLRGARLELKTGTEMLAGSIVGARLAAAGQNQPEREQVLLLLDNGELRTVDLAVAGSIRFTDPKLQTQLQEYLSVLRDARSTEKRSIFIDATGAKERSLVLSYAIPSAVWKSSYRLVFRGAADALLEGWAIVDNTTADDWNGVQMAVVSGRPVSFVSNLYQPRFVERLQAYLDEERPSAPVVYEGALGDAVSAGAPAAPGLFRRDPRLKSAVGGAMPDGFAHSESNAARRSQAESVVAVNTSERDMGGLFEYRFSTPVTVKHGESAMLPFVQQPIPARKLLIYSESYGLHPMNAAELTNGTGKTLDGGPITVFDSNSYAGEALVETLKAGDKRLISYASDLGTRVTTALEGTRDVVREVHFLRGVLTTRSALQETKVYTIRNVDPGAKTLILEHPARAGFKVLNQKPAETTAQSLRFEVKLPAQSTEKFPVLEEHVYETTTAVSSIAPDIMTSYTQNRVLPDSARAALRRILDQKSRIAAVDAEGRQVQEETSEMTRDQDRVRKNIASLKDIPGQAEQVQRYSRQLAAQEGQLASLRDRASEVRKKKITLESELNSLLEHLEF